MSYYGDDKSSVEMSCLLLDVVLGCLHKCLLYNRQDKDNPHDAGGLFTLDCMKQLMKPIVSQVKRKLLHSHLKTVFYSRTFIYKCNVTNLLTHHSENKLNQRCGQLPGGLELIKVKIECFEMSFKSLCSLKT